MESPAARDEFHNYVVLQRLVMAATKPLRDRFLRRWKQLNRSDWTDDKAAGRFFLSPPGDQILKGAKNTQKKMLKDGNSAQWDISSLGLLLHSIPFREKKKKDIEQILQIRNAMSHRTSMLITDEEFTKLSTKLVAVLRSWGISQEDLDNLERTSEKKQEARNAQAHSLKEFGNKAYASGHHDEAIRLYADALGISGLSDAERAILYCNRCTAQLGLWQTRRPRDEQLLEAALLDGKLAKSLNPRYPKAYYRVGQVYEKLEKWKEAQKNFSRALAFEPANAEVEERLSVVTMKLNQRNRAEHLNPRSTPRTTEERVEERAADLNMDAEERKALKETMEELKKMDPTLADVWKGHDYRDGSETCEKSYERAAQYYGKAAQKGNAEALYNLAILHREGKGVREDLRLSHSLLERAAATPPHSGTSVGVAQAEQLLGLSYQEGVGVARNYPTAAVWYHRAVEHGSAPAANNLGLLYQKGLGVEANLKKAEDLFLRAHTQGDHNSTVNLVDLYLGQNEPQQALLWHERALEKGHSEALARDQVTRARIKSLELCTGLGKENPLMKFTQELGNAMAASVTPMSLSNTGTIDLEMLHQYAQNGSVTAEQLLKSHDCFEKVFALLYQTEGDVDDKDFIAALFKAFEHRHAFSQFPVGFHQLALEVVKKSLRRQRDQISQFNEQTRICFAFLSLENPQLGVECIENLLHHYEGTQKVYHLQGVMYGFMARWDQAITSFTRALALDPSNVESMYSYAASLRMKAGLKDVIASYKKFLVAAPFDHRKVPEAYYSLAWILLESSPSSIKEIKAYYDQGLDSEKSQLPCFLPYKSPRKKLIADFITMTEPTTSKDPDSNSTRTTSPLRPADHLENPFREELIKNFRQDAFSYYQFLVKNASEGKQALMVTKKLPKRQTMAPSLVGLKAVYLRDLDYRNDQVMTGCVLTVTSFDICDFRTAAFFLVEDEQGSLQSLAIYNLGDNHDQIRKDYAIGVQFHIVHPYARIATDGKPLVRVDDPRSIVFTGRKKLKMCRYCGREDALLICSRCGSASYCNKECQGKDWKQLSHKSICNLGMLFKCTSP